MWDILKIISKGEYDYALVPNHPKATKNGYVLLHRVVMENFIGRMLDKDEIIHHKDKNKKNNKIENLQLMQRKEHNRLHSEEKKNTTSLICAFCGASFERKTSDINKKYTRHFCSRSCSSKYYWPNSNFRNSYGKKLRAKRKSRETTQQYRENMSLAMKKSWEKRKRCS